MRYFASSGAGAPPIHVKRMGADLRLRAARPADAEAIAAAEAETQRTPGLLVGQPGEIPVAAYRGKIAQLATEGRYLVAEEWAETAEDVLWRRTRCGLHMTAEECDAVAAFLLQSR